MDIHINIKTSYEHCQSVSLIEDGEALYFNIDNYKWNGSRKCDVVEENADILDYTTLQLTKSQAERIHAALGALIPFLDDEETSND